MRYILNLFLVLCLLTTSCEKNKVDALTSDCTYPWGNVTRTDQFVKEAPATITAITFPGQQLSYQIMRGGNSTPFGSCNLPTGFAKDSLKVIVSGYLLTFPGMELMNISPLPFEVTAIKNRE